MIVLATPPAPDVTTVYTEPPPDVTTVYTEAAPEVISVASEVPTLPASDVITVAMLPAPLVTVDATPVATLSTVDAIPVPTDSAPEVTTEMIEESCADARGAATSGRRMADERIVVLLCTSNMRTEVVRRNRSRGVEIELEDREVIKCPTAAYISSRNNHTTYIIANVCKPHSSASESKFARPRRRSRVAQKASCSCSCSSLGMLAGLVSCSADLAIRGISRA